MENRNLFYDEVYYRQTYLKRKKREKILTGLLIGLVFVLTGILMALMFLMGKTSAEKAKNNVYQTWNLQKENYTMRIYAKGSTYEREIVLAAEKYNDIEPIFALISTPENADIVCYDYEEAMGEKVGILGLTESSGRIGFNRYLLRSASMNDIISVAMHELGHAAGLAHNKEPGSIMNSKNNPIELSENDIKRIKIIYGEKKEKPSIVESICKRRNHDK